MKSGINHVEFYNHQYYDENFLDKLVVAACEVLGMIPVGIIIKNCINYLLVSTLYGYQNVWQHAME